MSEEKAEKAPAGPKTDSKFRHVLVAARRAEQLMRGARPKIEPGSGRIKPTRLAMAEVDGQAVEWGYGPAPEEPQAPAEAAAPEAEVAQEVH